MAEEIRIGHEPPVCAKHRIFLDEDGRCSRCRQEQWLFDDQAAKRGVTIVDETEPRGHEN